MESWCYLFGLCTSLIPVILLIVVMCNNTMLASGHVYLEQNSGGSLHFQLYSHSVARQQKGKWGTGALGALSDIGNAVNPFSSSTDADHIVRQDSFGFTGDGVQGVNDHNFDWIRRCGSLQVSLWFTLFFMIVFIVVILITAAGVNACAVCVGCCCAECIGHYHPNDGSLTKKEMFNFALHRHHNAPSTMLSHLMKNDR